MTLRATVQPLSVFVDDASQSSPIDLGAAASVKACLTYVGLGNNSTLIVTAQHSVDGRNWAAVPGLSWSIPGIDVGGDGPSGAQTLTSSGTLLRFIRFAYELTSVGDKVPVTFSLDIEVHDLVS